MAVVSKSTLAKAHAHSQKKPTTESPQEKQKIKKNEKPVKPSNTLPPGPVYVEEPYTEPVEEEIDDSDFEEIRAETEEQTQAIIDCVDQASIADTGEEERNIAEQPEEQTQPQPEAPTVRRLLKFTSWAEFERFSNEAGVALKHENKQAIKSMLKVARTLNTYFVLNIDTSEVYIEKPAGLVEERKEDSGLSQATVKGVCSKFTLVLVACLVVLAVIAGIMNAKCPQYFNFNFAPDTKKVDYYGLLQVDKSATDAAIRKSYYKLAKEYHPDRNPNCNECPAMMSALSEAYEVLSDPERRKHFDLYGVDGNLQNKKKNPKKKNEYPVRPVRKFY